MISSFLGFTILGLIVRDTCIILRLNLLPRHSPGGLGSASGAVLLGKILMGVRLGGRHSSGERGRASRGFWLYGRRDTNNRVVKWAVAGRNASVFLTLFDPRPGRPNVRGCPRGP